MEICVATQEHVEELAGLFQEQAAAMTALQPLYFQKVPHDRAYVGAVIGREDTEILLAVEDEEILGFTQLRETMTPDFASLVEYRYAHLLDLYVRKKARGQYIGRALLHAANEWATERRLSFIELQVLPENREAMAVYLRESYVPAMHTLRRML
jgi:ribosomal protein S18 acetylase RimI-like enzyme